MKSSGKGVLGRGNSTGEAWSEGERGAFGETPRTGVVGAQPGGGEMGEDSGASETT